MSDRSGKYLILYDSECGFCDSFVLFIAKKDKHNVFQFASLYSNTARPYLTLDSAGLPDRNTLVCVKNECIYNRSEAVLQILSELPGFKILVQFVRKAIPLSIRDLGYKIFARYRRRVWAKKSCQIPPLSIRIKFIET